MATFRIPLYYGSAVPASPGALPAVLIPGDGRNAADDPAFQAAAAVDNSPPLILPRILGYDGDDLNIRTM
jgi:hypothetical protein